ncbi:hypothetical protein CVT24_006198 [Panaeolus cyanescens]|uniref:Uncharacterized protein n=1 Tax=Panaeolus cyanescens TaxID=181874 RepID=A0A409WHM2_9AGAR|nr:hypothetical protein CVT24_006198 [Panaeolus cyanescens]
MPTKKELKLKEKEDSHGSGSPRPAPQPGDYSLYPQISNSPREMPSSPVIPLASISNVRFASPIEQASNGSPKSQIQEVARNDNRITSPESEITQHHNKGFGSEEREHSEDSSENEDQTEKYVEEELAPISGPRILSASETFKYFNLKVYFPASVPLFHFPDQTLEESVRKRQREANELAEHYLGRIIKRPQNRLNRAERRPFVKAYDLLMDSINAHVQGCQLGNATFFSPNDDAIRSMNLIASMKCSEGQRKRILNDSEMIRHTESQAEDQALPEVEDQDHQEAEDQDHLEVEDQDPREVEDQAPLEEDHLEVDLQRTIDQEDRYI